MRGIGINQWLEGTGCDMGYLLHCRHAPAQELVTQDMVTRLVLHDHAKGLQVRDGAMQGLSRMKCRHKDMVSYLQIGLLRR